MTKGEIKPQVLAQLRFKTRSDPLAGVFRKNGAARRGPRCGRVIGGAGAHREAFIDLITATLGKKP